MNRGHDRLRLLLKGLLMMQRRSQCNHSNAIRTRSISVLTSVMTMSNIARRVAAIVPSCSQYTLYAVRIVYVA